LQQAIEGAETNRFWNERGVILPFAILTFILTLERLNPSLLMESLILLSSIEVGAGNWNRTLVSGHFY
jgi:hypothetical protein